MYRKGPKPSPPKGSLWIEQAAAHIGLTVGTLRKWRLLGKDVEAGMPGWKVGGYVAYKVTDLDAYLEAQYQAALQPDPDREAESRPPEPRLTPRKKAAPKPAEDEELQPAA